MEVNALIKKKEAKYTILSIFLLLIFLLAILFFSSIVKLDTYTVGRGYISFDKKKIPILYKDWGYIEKIFVKEGDTIKRNDIIAVIKNYKALAEYKAFKKKYYLLVGLRDTLLSEISLKEEITFSPEFKRLSDEQLKHQILNLLQKKFKIDMSILKKKIKLINKQLSAYKESLVNLKRVLQIKEKTINIYKKLIEQERKLVNAKLQDIEKLYNYQIRFLDLKSQLRDIKGKIKDLKNKIQALEIQQKLTLQDFLNKRLTELQNINKELADIKSNLSIYKNEIFYTFIKAPISGQIITLNYSNKGQLIKPGSIIAEIAPINGTVKFWIFLEPQKRFKVHKNQKAQIHIAGINSLTLSYIPARVAFVSSDTIEISHKKFYKCLLVPTDEGKKILRKLKLTSGIPISAYIVTGKVTPLEYILTPVIQIIKKTFVNP
jgi:HlyD family type I secretion membrane fusion protein